MKARYMKMNSIVPDDMEMVNEMFTLYGYRLICIVPREFNNGFVYWFEDIEK